MASIIRNSFVNFGIILISIHQKRTNDRVLYIFNGKSGSLKNPTSNLFSLEGYSISKLNRIKSGNNAIYPGVPQGVGVEWDLWFAWVISVKFYTSSLVQKTSECERYNINYEILVSPVKNDIMSIMKFSSNSRQSCREELFVLLVVSFAVISQIYVSKLFSSGHTNFPPSHVAFGVNFSPLSNSYEIVVTQRVFIHR